MRILLLGRPGPDLRAAAEILSSAGHDTTDCFSGPASWACRAADGPCPLDAHTDVAVAARQQDEPSYDGQGAVCARRRRVPIVAIGAERSDGIFALADAVVHDADSDLVAACDRLARGPSAAHTRAARRALADQVRPDEVVDVTVDRRPGGLHAWMSTSVEDRNRRNALVDRVRAGLARFDPEARGIGVSVRQIEPLDH
jgi:hypothetical protein